MLNQFADGKTTSDTIETVFAMTPAQFDQQFADYVASQHGAILGNLDDWHRTQQSISQHVSAQDWQAVPELARHLIDLLPQYIEPDSPYIALARALDEQEDRQAAIAALEKFWRQGGYDPDALRQLADWLAVANRNDDAVAVLQTVNLVDPLDRELHGELGDMLLAAGRADEALLEFKVALALEPHDRATAYYRMAQAYYELGNRESSQDNLLQALDVAPNFRPAQRLLLELARTEPGEDDR